MSTRSKLKARMLARSKPQVIASLRSALRTTLEEGQTDCWVLKDVFPPEPTFESSRIAIFKVLESALEDANAQVDAYAAWRFVAGSPQPYSEGFAKFDEEQVEELLLGLTIRKLVVGFPPDILHALHSAPRGAAK